MEYFESIRIIAFLIVNANIANFDPSLSLISCVSVIKFPILFQIYVCRNDLFI